jgi:hypothetical protein
MAAIHQTASMVLTLTENQRRVLLLTLLTFMVMC